MKNLTSLLLAATFCFVGIGLAGCGGSQENTVVDASGPSTETGDAVLQSQNQMDQYEAEMQKAMSQQGGGGGGAAAEE